MNETVWKVYPCSGFHARYASQVTISLVRHCSLKSAFPPTSAYYIPRQKDTSKASRLALGVGQQQQESI